MMNCEISEFTSRTCEKGTKGCGIEHGNSSALSGVLSGDFGTIETPFNIEEILRACPNLYAKWKEHPFTLELTESGYVTVVYL
jgi:hypothetical protein